MLKEGKPAEEAFGAALGATSDKQDRANMVAKLLNKTYGKSKTTYDNLSGSILDANKAEAELKETQAELGETLTPLNTRFTELKNKALNAMAPMIEKVADAFIELIDGIDWDAGARLIGNVMEVAMKGLEWLMDNIDLVSGMVAGLGTAWLTYKTYVMIADAAQKILNATMSSSPLGALKLGISAIVGVTMAAVSWSKQYADALEAEIEKTYGLTQEEKKLFDEINNVYEANQRTNEARKENFDKLEQEYVYYEQLAEELRSITDENGKVKKGYEDRAAVITGMLSEALGIEIEITDGVIQKYGELSDSIDLIIQKKAAEALLEANREAYAEALQNQTDAYMRMAEAQDVLAEKTAKAEEAEAALKEAQEKLKIAQMHGSPAATELSKEVAKLSMAHDEAEASVAEAEQKVKDAETTWESYNATIQNNKGLAAATVSGDSTKIQQAMLDMQNSFITAEYASKDSLERQVSNMQALYKELKTKIEKGAPGVTQEMVDNAKYMVDKSVIELGKFEKKSGKPAINGVKNFAGSIYNESWRAIDKADYLTGKIEGKLNIDTKPKGKQVTEGLADGMTATDVIRQVVNAASSVAGVVNSALRSKLEINSPSKVARRIGKGVPEGLACGIADDEKLVKKASANLADAAVKPFGMLKKGTSSLFDGIFLGDFETGYERGISSFQGIDTSDLVASMQSRAFELSAKYHPVIEYEDVLNGSAGDDIPIVINNTFEVDGEPLVTKTTKAAMKRIGNEQRQRGRFQGAYV
ncbi:Uncharacterised protein [uncultured Roseburia sp.]|nr:hypothetical protein [Brotonthovivens ammoniilytica]SCJ23626.1 Uncharacterised protein [uncultured Roseburia sp.]